MNGLRLEFLPARLKLPGRLELAILAIEQQMLQMLLVQRHSQQLEPQKLLVGFDQLSAVLPKVLKLTNFFV